MSENVEMPKGVDANCSEQITNQLRNQNESPGQEEEEVPAETRVMRGAIPHILERIVGHLPLESQKECRLVNSDWNQAAMKQLRKNLPLLSLNGDIKIELFLDRVKNTKVSPFAKFSINLSRYNEVSKPLLGMLFETIAPLALELEVHFETSYVIARQSSDNLNIEISKKLDYPSLTVLVLEQEVYSSDAFPLTNGRLEQELQPLLQMVEKSPKLQELDWTGPFDQNWNSYILHILIGSLEKKTNDCLAHLRLSSRDGFENGHFLRLARLGLKLKSFTLNGMFIDARRANFETGRELIQFLHTQSDSLEELHLVSFVGVFDRNEFPPFRRLTTLKVDGWRTFDRNFHPTPKIDYNRCLPVLKTVEFVHDHKDNWVHFLPDPTSTPALSVVELKLPKTVYSFFHYENHLLHAVNYFPNLKILRIPANRNLVNIIHNSLPLLEELILDIGLRNNSIDDIITGFSLEGCDLIRLFSEEMFQRFETNMGNLGFHNDSLRPLSFLKCLKILRIETGGDEHSVEETDRRGRRTLAEFSTVATRLVLTKMPSLETVDFGRRTSSSVEKLHDVFNDLRESGKLVLYEDTGADDFEPEYYDDDDDDDDPFDGVFEKLLAMADYY